MLEEVVTALVRNRKVGSSGLSSISNWKVYSLSLSSSFINPFGSI